MCKKKGCDNSFTPTDRRQLYCCPQHRIDHNNDERAIKSMPVIALTEILKNNQRILEVAQQALTDIKDNSMLTSECLKFIGYDWQYSTDRTKNIITEREITWCYHYGIEAENDSASRFILHYREKLPFL